MARKTTQAEPAAEKKYFLVDNDGDVRGPIFDSIEEVVEYSEGCSDDPFKVFEGVQIGAVKIEKAKFVPLA